MSQSVNERTMTDEELQVMLKFYDPAYKKTGKMSDLEWQIGLKKLHHFQARERKEQEAKLKEAKLKEKEEKQREKEEMKKEKEQRGAEKTVRKSLSVSLINDASLSVASSNGGKVSAAKEVAPVKKVVPARRGRKTLDNSEVISTKSNDSSSLQNGDNGENDSMIDNDAKNMINAAIKKVTQKAQATKRGRASLNSVSTTTEVVDPPADPVVKKRNVAPQRGGRKKVQEEPSVAETEVKQVLSPIKETEEVLNTTKTLSPAKNVSPAKTVLPAVTKNGRGVVDVGGVDVDVTNVALGKPADKLKIALYILDNKKQWQLLTQSQTQSKGQCADVITGQQLKKGLYKLNFDTSAYFQRVNLVSSFPGIEIQFEVKDTSERHRISVDIGPYHYGHTHNTYVGPYHYAIHI